jgi:small redox-active disulfide protein 2
MKIRVLGSGCAKCKSLYNLVVKALIELDIAADLAKIEDIKEIVSYKVLGTPALVINDQVMFYGKVPSFEEIKSTLLAEKNKKDK